MTFDHQLAGRSARVRDTGTAPVYRAGQSALIAGHRMNDGNGRPEFLLEFSDGELEFFDYRQLIVQPKG